MVVSQRYAAFLFPVVDLFSLCPFIIRPRIGYLHCRSLGVTKTILQETIKIVGAKNYFSQENLTTFNKEKNTIFAGKRSRVWEKTALEVRDRCRHALLRARRASSAAPLCSRDRSQTSYFF